MRVTPGLALEFFVDFSVLDWVAEIGEIPDRSRAALCSKQLNLR
jgi:hypothetical protein